MERLPLRRRSRLRTSKGKSETKSPVSTLGGDAVVNESGHFGFETADNQEHQKQVYAGFPLVGNGVEMHDLARKEHSQ